MGSFRNFMLSADPAAGYDAASVKRHWKPEYGPLRMSKNVARGNGARHTYNVPPDRFPTAGKRSTPFCRPREGTHRRRAKPQEKKPGIGDCPPDECSESMILLAMTNVMLHRLCPG
jgi:hypothetical protein